MATPKVHAQVYTDADGIPTLVTLFEDGYVGRYLDASSDTLCHLLTLPRYQGSRAGAALAFALARREEIAR